MQKERKAKEAKNADEELRKKLEKNALQAVWDDYMDYSEKDLHSIFAKHGIIAKIWMEDLENKAIVAYDTSQSCIRACDDKEFPKDFFIKVKFLGDRTSKRKRNVALSWQKKKRPSSEFLNYEQQVLARLMRLPRLNPENDDNRMDLGDSD